MAEDPGTAAVRNAIGDFERRLAATLQAGGEGHLDTYLTWCCIRPFRHLVQFSWKYDALSVCHYSQNTEHTMHVGWIEKHFFWKVQGVNVAKVALWYQNTVYEI